MVATTWSNFPQDYTSSSLNTSIILSRQQIWLNYQFSSQALIFRCLEQGKTSLLAKKQPSGLVDTDLMHWNRKFYFLISQK